MIGGKKDLKERCKNKKIMKNISEINKWATKVNQHWG